LAWFSWDKFDTLVRSEKVQTKECKNNLSARVQETVVSELIDKELQKGFIYGPFTQPPFDNYRVSPIGVAEGKYSKKKRLILDLFSTVIIAIILSAIAFGGSTVKKLASKCRMFIIL
jgi:hypothetical protein